VSVELEVVTKNLAVARAAVAEAAARSGRTEGAVELLAAVKYVEPGDLETLAAAGIRLVGENRVEQLLAKQEVARDLFTWDFIGHLQSRKVRQVLPHVRYIETVASDSVLAQLEHHASPDTEVLVEVNVAREAGKSGLDPDELPAFLERCPVTVVGLMTMPPLAHYAEDSRRHFAALRELAETHGLRELSMGTSQDYLVAAQEGATIVRLGTSLYA
jgi:pyridoxal phosphate enzyme (YggS family)